jgi:hypothetical protein
MVRHGDGEAGLIHARGCKPLESRFAHAIGSDIGATKRRWGGGALADTVLGGEGACGAASGLFGLQGLAPILNSLSSALTTLMRSDKEDIPSNIGVLLSAPSGPNERQSHTITHHHALSHATILHITRQHKRRTLDACAGCGDVETLSHTRPRDSGNPWGLQRCETAVQQPEQESSPRTRNRRERHLCSSQHAVQHATATASRQQKIRLARNATPHA